MQRGLKSKAVRLVRAGMGKQTARVEVMARGWESKSIESQIEALKAAEEATGKEQLTVEVAAALRRQETLLLARTHLQQQIDTAQHPRHREMLQCALADLEKQLAHATVVKNAAA